MPSTLIESILRGLSASALTNLILLALISLFVFAIISKRQHKLPQFTNYAPTLLTSLGILGTFAGIIIGLLAFDTGDIDGSIGPLLEGLKTAFISSLAGMLLSITYKGIVTTGFMIPKQAEITNEDDISSFDFYKVMQEQVATTELLRQSIAGDEDSSLISLIKLQRADANDQHRKLDGHLKVISESATDLKQLSKTQQEEFAAFQDRLWIKLQDFADMMSKSATEQVVEALKQSISEFNTNLTEQFGDNFKELNLAVGKLVEWQDNYKEQLQDMSAQYAQGVEAIAATQVSVATISEDAKVIPETMTNLKTVIELNQHQITELDRHLEAFKDVRDKAVEAIPEIQEQIDAALQGARAANDELAQGILTSGQEFQKVLNEGATDLKDNVGQATVALSEQATATASSSEEIRDQFTAVITEINNNMRNLITELQEGGSSLSSSYEQAAKTLISENSAIQKSFSEELSQLQTSLSSTIKEQADEHRRQADRVFLGLEKTIGESLQSTGESVQRQVDMIDKTMEAEITKVMESMGSALVSISGQFTSDYKKLVDEMNQIVRTRQ
jgi:chromosome segregation ATPase